MQFQPTRRRLLAASAFAAAGFMVDDAFAEPLAPTPQCHDGDAPTVRQGEGPFFKPSSPERADLVEPTSKARLVELRGQVLAPVVRFRGRSSISGTPTRAANTTPADFTIVDIYSRMLRDAIASAPFCQRSTPAAPVTITSRCKRRSSACSPLNSIFLTNR
jgi:hypothetical protein